MRVLHCIATMGGGGAERQLCYLASGLVARGHEVTVAVQRGGPNLARLEASGARVEWVTDASATDPRLTAAIAGLFARRRPAVVQTWLPRMDVAAGAASLACRRPWVLTERAVASASGGRVRQWLARGARAVVANSAEGTREWERVAPGRVRVIPNATPVEEVDAAPEFDLERLGVPADARVILYTGRFEVRQKNVLLLADALVDVLRERPDVYAVCAGDGPDRSAFLARVAGSPVAARVITPGYVCEVFSLLKRADAFVSPSHFEGRPNTVAEAMAARAPLCISDIPQHTEFVPRDAAIYFDQTSASGIVGALRACLDDPAAAEARSARARAVIERHSVAEMALAYESLYREVARA